MTRRDLLRSMAATAAISAAEAMFPGILFAAAGGPSAGAGETGESGGGVTWRKTPCRFCGVGCGLLVGLDNGRAVAVKGDPASPVNRGLCCVKGYHSVLALYGKDRLTQAMVRRGGKLVPVPMKEALDLVASKMAETIKAHGKEEMMKKISGKDPEFLQGSLYVDMRDINTGIVLARSERHDDFVGRLVAEIDKNVATDPDLALLRSEG